MNEDKPNTIPTMQTGTVQLQTIIQRQFNALEQRLFQRLEQLFSEHFPKEPPAKKEKKTA
jgi:hypothetical protein